MNLNETSLTWTGLDSPEDGNISILADCKVWWAATPEVDQ